MSILNPSDVRADTGEEGGHGVHEDRKYSFAAQSAGLAQGEDSFRPPVSFLAGGPKAGLPPEHGKSQETFGVIVGRLHSGLLEEQPQVIHLLNEASGQLAGVVLPVEILAHQANETGIKHVPFADRGRSFGHMAQPLQLLVCPRATLDYFGVFSFRKSLGLPNQMRQAGLPQPHPLHVDAIPVTDQDAAPILDQSLESLFRPIAMDHEEGNHRIAHDPQPLEHPLAPPGCFIHMVDGGVSRDLGDGFVVWQYGGGHAVDDVLDATLADLQIQNRKEKVLDGASAVGLGAGHDGDNGRKPRTEARAVQRGNECLDHFPAVSASPSMQDEVSHFQFDRGKFNDLMI